MTQILNRINRVCTFIGGGILVGIMLLIVANIIFRVLGSVIMGTYELVEVFIVITVAFAICYMAMEQGHVVFDILLARLTPRSQAFLKIITSVLSIGTLLSLAWATIQWMNETTRVGVEKTDVLKVNIFPFKAIWVFGLVLFFLFLVVELFSAIKGVGRRK